MNRQELRKVRKNNDTTFITIINEGGPEIKP